MRIANEKIKFPAKSYGTSVKRINVRKSMFLFFNVLMLQEFVKKLRKTQNLKKTSRFFAKLYGKSFNKKIEHVKKSFVVAKA